MPSRRQVISREWRTGDSVDNVDGGPDIFHCPLCVANSRNVPLVASSTSESLTNEPTAVPFTIVVSRFEKRDFVVDLAAFEESNEPTGRLVAADGV